jgi:hypothetical protein
MELDHWYFVCPLEADAETTHPLPPMVKLLETVERSPGKVAARGTWIDTSGAPQPHPS